MLVRLIEPDPLREQRWLGLTVSDAVVNRVLALQPASLDAALSSLPVLVTEAMAARRVPAELDPELTAPLTTFVLDKCRQVLRSIHQQYGRFLPSMRMPLTRSRAAGGADA